MTKTSRAKTKTIQETEVVKIEDVKPTEEENIHKVQYITLKSSIPYLNVDGFIFIKDTLVLKDRATADYLLRHSQITEKE